MVKKVFINASAQTVGKVVTASTTLVITAIIGRALGPSEYGNFIKVFTFVGYFYTFADFGLNAAFIKLTKEKEDGLIRTLLFLRLAMAIIFATLAVVISMTLPYDETRGTGFNPAVKTAILIASLTIVTQAAFTTFNAFFQKKLRYDLSAISSVAGTFVILLLALLFSVLGSSISLFAAAYVAGGATFAGVAYFLILTKFRLGISPRVSILGVKSLLKTAWPIGTALIFNLIYFRSDIFILSYVRGSADVGVYGLAYQFFEAALAIPIFFANALFPLMNTLKQKEPALYRMQAKNWFLLMLGISFLLMMGLVMSSFLIPLIFQNFIGSQTALIILALGIPFFFVSALLWHLTIIEGKQKTLIPIYLSGGLINIALNLLFIPKFGYIAAAITTVASEALIAVLLTATVYFIFRKAARL